MRIALIVAMDLQRVIGRDNDLPWRLPTDLRRFRRLTLGKPILMGRKTHESVGKALDGRTNVIITRQSDYSSEGCKVAHDVEGALALVPDAEEVMIIGGAEIYALFLPLADRLYLTRVEASCPGDTFFPELTPEDWETVAQEAHPADEKNPLAHTFLVLDRRPSST